MLRRVLLYSVGILNFVIHLGTVAFGKMLMLTLGGGGVTTVCLTGSGCRCSYCSVMAYFEGAEVKILMG
jgi:hypothetical protein